MSTQKMTTDLDEDDTDAATEDDIKQRVRGVKKDAKVDDNAESSSSAGSSEGKSRGGYSADCSASDQSSDDTGERKARSNAKLSLDRIDLNATIEATSEVTGSRRSSPAIEEDDDNEEEATASEPKHIVEANLKKLPQESSQIAKQATASAGEAAAAIKNRKTKKVASKIGLDLRKSPNALDIEKILNYKPDEDGEMEPYFDGSQPFPQWNGVKIKGPMDCRIDFSTVGHVEALPVPTNLPTTTDQNSKGQAKSFPDDTERTVEHYRELMEVIRPFFHASGIEVNPQASNEQQHWSTAADSSEGFTSFFTTTNSGTNSGSTNSPNSSDMEKKRASKQADEQEVAEEIDDASSMAVLAPSRATHKRSSDESGSNSSSSREKRVRIQEQNHGDHANDASSEETKQSGSAIESSTSSSSSGQANVEQAAQDHAVPPRIVTDISSSNRTDGTTSNNTSSGSAENTGSGSNNGSGSNQGSSGGEGKGSSELGKEDNSGEATNDGSDGSDKKLGLGLDTKVHPHHHHDPHVTQPHHHEASKDAQVGETEREKKLLDKKRKRLEMRREYEAQQQQDSSESSAYKGDALLRPGTPVTLDQALGFSRIPRIVIQSTPPFVVVHTNAAYARLTGVDSHAVVGKPISALLSLSVAPQGISSSGAESANQQADAASDEARAEETAERRHNLGLERLVASCGFGHLCPMQVVAKSHHMLGRNVMVVNGNGAAAASGSKAQSSGGRDEASTTSSYKCDGGVHHITCLSSISPIVSSPAAMDSSSIAAGKEPETHQVAKRRKHNDRCEHHTLQYRKHGRQFITHYVIQLQSQEGASYKQGSMESLSSNSTSVEARLLGLSKPELQRQRRAAAEPADLEIQVEEINSESTETKEPVSAIG